MTNRYEDAQWYISGDDPLSATICDASDPLGDGPDGHGMVCESAVLEDARLIAIAPDLLRIVQTLLASWECDPDEDAQYENLMDKAIGEARQAIGKIEGTIRFYDDCATGYHDCYNQDQVCGCRCSSCIDLTEPRCNRCNAVLAHGACPDIEEETISEVE